MGSLTISEKIIDKYFSYLKNLDNAAKRSLINRLTKSIESKPPKKTDLKALFGAWEDTRNSDEIISEIKDSRVDKVIKGSFD